MMVHYIPLDADRRRDLVTATQLHAQMPDVLARFEIDLLWELSERGLAGTDAVATADEWRIVEDYSAAVKATSSVITVKIEVTDTYALAELLRDLGSLKYAHARRASGAAE